MAELDEVMTTMDAAHALGVSTRQARRLVAIGVLAEAGRVGGTLLVDARSVHRLVARGSQRGRLWSEHVAWAAIDLLETGDTERINAAQRSRLRARLRDMDALGLAQFARGRASVHRLRAAGSVSRELRRNLTLTAMCAVAADRGIAAALGLAGGEAHVVDGYVQRRSVDSYVDQFFLVPDHSGNVVLRATDGDILLGGVAPSAAIALDLMDSLDPRVHAAGRRALDQSLQRV